MLYGPQSKPKDASGKRSFHQKRKVVNCIIARIVVLLPRFFSIAMKRVLRWIGLYLIVLVLSVLSSIARNMLRVIEKYYLPKI